MVREYFDGEYYLYAGSTYFKSADRYGNTDEWGRCLCESNTFKVIGNYVFLNGTFYDEHQYPLSAKRPAPIREKSWFGDPVPREVVDEFELYGDLEFWSNLDE